MGIRHALILFLLCLARSIFAQNWSAVDPYAYNDETVVYVALKTNVPTDPMTDFVVAAFIDDECRAEAKAPVVGIDSSQFFVLRVMGDQTTDLGKTISFKVYHKPMQNTYTITPPTVITYTGESLGIPSNPIIFSFDREIGETVALQSLFVSVSRHAYGQITRIKLEPNPYNASFDAYAIQVSLNGALEDWPAAGVQRAEDDLLSFEITPHYPGTYQLQATLGDTPIDLLDMTGGSMSPIKIGNQLDLQKGWQWCSNPYGDITADNIYDIFNSHVFIEARTQQDLLYKDPTWGYFGTIMETGIAQNTCYKVKMSDTPAPTFLLNGHYDSAYQILLNGEWTWVAIPYYYDHAIFEALDPSKVTIPEGMTIVSKEDGQAEFDGTAWKGDLTILRKGQGLMVYCPLSEPFTLNFLPEAGMQLNNAPSRQADIYPEASRESTNWHYDASRFMNNTTVIAAIPDVANLSAEWTIGAFVTNECRGEGHFIDGHFFITIHADHGETISLKLRHEPTGQTFDVEEKLTTGQMHIGSLRAPLLLHTDAYLSGINQSRTEQVTADCYDLTGRRQTGTHKGLILQRQTNGKISKILVR